MSTVYQTRVNLNSIVVRLQKCFYGRTKAPVGEVLDGAKKVVCMPNERL